MSRAAVAIAGALLLAACPIPQSVPDYPPGSITPPRILMDRLPLANQTIIYVPGDCPPGQAPTFALSATLDDVNTIEDVVARWFVNYDPTVSGRYRPAEESEIPGTGPLDGPTLRAVPPWTFDPLLGGYGTATNPLNGVATDDGALQVVELVVSNSFNDAATALPNRTPSTGFETQVYRWIFVTRNPRGTLECPLPSP